MSALSIAEALVEAAQALRRAGVAEARREAGSLLADTVARDRTFLITHAEQLLGPDELSRFREAVKRREAGEPLQYITGRQEFFGLDFEVTPAVLIPRPETELLVETALELLAETTETDAPPLVCDVGTGSGCIIVTLLHERRRMRGVALDISPPALRVAARNAARHHVSERLSLVASDCFSALDASSARFSMIVSNPPYIAESALDGLQREVHEHEPRAALTPGGDGLRVIERIIEDAPPFLNSGGHLLLEIGYDQHEAIRASFAAAATAWQLLDIRTDLQGIPRAVVARKK
ncbi:MAG: release factor glutamine methyltransferase [Blastocatellia bacterium]|jgi:release factor glutamine methyltransferase|nr:release factor glutamine methyltransferase [Blastocatellia bacterium]